MPGTATIYVPRQTTGRGHKKNRSPSEELWYQWLRAHGWKVTWEPLDFPIPGDVYTPDGRLGTKDSSGTRIFFEHTDADRKTSQRDLPEHVQEKNLRRGKSGKPYIQVKEYIRRKRAKIQPAERIYGITVVLLPHVVREQIQARPELLQELIDLKIRDAREFDAYIDAQIEVVLANIRERHPVAV